MKIYLLVEFNSEKDNLNYQSHIYKIKINLFKYLSYS